MQGVIPSIPDGWHALGALPPFDFQHADESLRRDWFTEDVLQLSEPSGSYCIDIGWYIDGFCCRIIRGQDWRAPLMEFECKTVCETRAWLDEAIAFVRQRTLQ